VTRYVFIVEDLHLLLLAGLPAHYQPAERLTYGSPKFVMALPRLDRGIDRATCINTMLRVVARSSRAMT
jgi:hypothetical protein